ncbi:MAG: aldehyde ferredoxin oxidoreductase family protein [Deltaproteobacteria bacterium]|nr:aldehyde ferredoxin oxidoreductase family protein [Deltaproteobacteria bacterium]
MTMGYMGKILRVDLEKGKTEIESLDVGRAKAFIGGRGLGISYLLEEVNPECDPLSPENRLIMMTGPLTGTGAPTGARYMVMTKSPLTGAITCSNSGGQFPNMLKRTGFDGIIFEGSSSEPVYLWVEDNRAELRSAKHIWGKDTHQTTDQLIQETHNKARVACIGPAGENGVLFASIMNEKDRAAGRSGVGTVMGSKGLKAVVVNGTQKIPLRNEDAFRSVVKEYLDRFKEATQQQPLPLYTYGTAITIVGTQNVGVLPTRNFQQGTFEDWEKIGGEALTERYLVKPKACFSCPIACGRVTKIPDGPYQGEGEGPEYETVYALGSNCGINDLAALTKANYICNEMGMDTISMGATIASAMEMFEKGILRESDIGQPLPFGDSDGLIEMCQKTAYREGFGHDLALGSLRLTQKYGHPELAIVAKGQKFAGYDPRGEKGMGLAYATSNIGASHMRGDPAYIEILGVPMLIDPLTWEDKPKLVKEWQDVFSVIDSAGLCVFFSVRNYVTPTRDIKPEGILRLLNESTGADYDMEMLLQAGERIFNAERIFLVRAGFGAKDDSLPPRIVKEPLPDGPAKGHVCELEKMLPLYYEERGWDKDGHPTASKIKALGLNSF